MARTPDLLSRAVFRIQISPGAVETMHGIKDRIGITEIALCSRLVEWFADQPDEIKAGIIGGFAGLTDQPPEVAFLRRMAKGE